MHAANGWVVQRALSADAEGIYEVMQTTWMATYPNETLGISREYIRSRIGSSGDEISTARVQRWRDEIENPTRSIFVARTRAQVVGYVAPFFDEEHQQFRLGGLYVLPEMQGNGIGRRLVNESIESIGLEHDIYLHVVSYNLSSIRFYQRQGFVATGRDTTETDETGTTIPEFEMVRRS